MTAPDPPAEASVGAEAVEAAARALWSASRRGEDGWPVADVPAALAAALPYLRAQFLAEVDAALRDQGRYLEWYGRNLHLPATLGSLGDAADYLRDTLTPEED